MRHGFSLVELSIVLVILGLLTGGILAGQSLIRAAELRSVNTDLNRYQAAIYAFRDKYFAFPGDMNSATKFWGVANGTGSDSTCYQSLGAGTATCNGDGDGLIDYDAVRFNAEPHRAWQHLANAGLVEGNYTGIWDGTDVPGTLVPRGRMSNTGYSLVYIAYGSYFGETHSSQSNGNQLLFGTQASVMRGVALKPEEAWNVDTKMDDGKPDQGALQTDTSYSAACYTGSYPTAAYALSTTSIQCSLRYSLR